MSLKQRAQDYTQRHGAAGQGKNKDGQITPGTRTIDTFVTPVYGIVDGELCEVYGFADVPDMSLTAICSSLDGGGWTAPVPVTEVRLFRHLNKDAIASLLEAERNNTNRQ